jgi:D-psicose/D-tagatose/L-ribulose 3-epimerase
VILSPDSPVRRNLATIARYAARRGVTVCVEPPNRSEADFINTGDQALLKLDEVDSPPLGIHLDTFRMNIEEKSQPAAIRKAGKRLKHFHARACGRGTPGNDHIDWPSIAAAPKAVGYDRDVVIESFTLDVKVIAKATALWRQIEPSREKIATKGLRFLRKTLQAAGPSRQGV